MMAEVDTRLQSLVAFAGSRRDAWLRRFSVELKIKRRADRAMLQPVRDLGRRGGTLVGSPGRGTAGPDDPSDARAG